MKIPKLPLENHLHAQLSSRTDFPFTYAGALNSSTHRLIFPPLGLYSRAQEPPDQPLKLIHPYRMKSSLLPSFSPLPPMHFIMCGAVSSSLNEKVSQSILGHIF